MFFVPLVWAGMAGIPAVKGVLKGSAEAIAGVCYRRPTNLPARAKDGAFIQDLEIGESTGQFFRLHRRPYFRRYINRIKTSGMAMSVVSDRPANRVLEEMAGDRIYRDCKIIVTNGGACVYELTDPTKTNFNERFTKIGPDLKISEQSVEQLRFVIEHVSTQGGALNMPRGAFVVNTDESRNIYVPDGTSLFARIRISFGLKRRNIIKNDSYDAVKKEARNISFEIFPKFSHDFMIKRTSIARIKDRVTGNSTAAGAPSSDLDRFLKARFIRYIGRYSPTYDPVDPVAHPNISRYMNLPTLRNFFWRHKNTCADGLNQIDIARETLGNLISYSPSPGVDPAYLADTCVTFSTKGLEFVPKRASKTIAIEKMAELLAGPKPTLPAGYASMSAADKAAADKKLKADMAVWQKTYLVKMNYTAICGDNYADYMRPVSLKELRDRYNERVMESAKEAALSGTPVKPIDILDVFMELSVTPPGLSFEDIHEQGIRYNVTGNSCSASLLELKSGDERIKKLLMDETYDLLSAPLEEIEAKIQTIQKRITDLDAIYASGTGLLSGTDYRTARANLVNEMNAEQTKKANLKTKLNTPNPKTGKTLYEVQREKFKQYKKSLVDTTRYNRDLGHEATTGRELLDEVERVVNR